jgi:molybdate transport system permease protein
MTAVLNPLLLSLQIAAAAEIFTFFAGLAAAYFVERLSARRRFALASRVIDVLLTLPLVLPPTVVGFLLLYIFGLNGPAGKFLLDFFAVKIVFTRSAAVISAFVISFPLMYRSARAALQGLDSSLLDAGRVLGMGEWRLFWRVSFPTALPSIAAGAVLSFARALGEFGATAMIAGNIAGRTRTLPLAIYSETAAGNMARARDLVLVCAGFSFALLFTLNYFLFGKQKRAQRRRHTS